MENVFKSSVATVRYNPEYCLIYLEWHGHPSFEQYKAPFLYLIKDFKRPITGILADIRKQGIVGQEMRNWVQKEISPKAKERGLKFYYIVSDGNIFKQYYINAIFTLLQGSDLMDRKFFHEFDTGEAAIIQQIASQKARVLTV
jgi:hypothetical protein